MVNSVGIFFMFFMKINLTKEKEIFCGMKRIYHLSKNFQLWQKLLQHQPKNGKA